MNMDVKLNGVDEILSQLNPKLYSKSLNRTINDVGRKITTSMIKDVRKKYNISAKDLKKYMKVSRSSYSKLEYVIDISSKTRNVKHFSPKALSAKGKVSIKIKKGKKRSVLIPAFKAKNSGAILTRVKGTQKIKAVQTLSVTQMFNKKTLEIAEEINEKEFGKTFKKNFDFYTGKL